MGTTPLAVQVVPIVLFLCAVTATVALVAIAYYMRQMRELAERLTAHLTEVANVENQLSVVAQGVHGLTLELEEVRKTFAKIDRHRDYPT
jgi:chromosome segregation ATPase